jgi:hypothetical protein
MSFPVQGTAELQPGLLEKPIVNLARFCLPQGRVQLPDFFQLAAALGARPHMIVKRRAVLLRQLIIQEEIHHFFVSPVLHRFTLL